MLAERSLPPEAWCGVIGALELGLNTAIAESIGKPPALGAFGELPKLPVVVIVGTGAPVEVSEMSQQVKTTMKEARKQLEKAQAYQKRYYDAHHCH